MNGCRLSTGSKERKKLTPKPVRLGPRTVLGSRQRMRAKKGINAVNRYLKNLSQNLV